MRRITLFALSFLILVSLCACGENGSTDNVVTKPAPTIQVVEGQPISQLDDVSVYIGVTGQSKAVEGLPSYTYSEGAKPVVNPVDKIRDGLKAYVFSNTDAAAYIHYLNALEADGWQQYSNNIIAGTNLFATYTKDEQSVYCYYISSKNRSYIIQSPNQNLEPREVDNQYETVCKPLLTQVKLLNSTWDGGMSYVIRLSDGRFIIVDGGFIEKNNHESKHLYSLLQEQNVLDKITIAAWIVTHPHRDHFGVTSEFLRNYTSKDVEIQNMIYNFPSDDALLKVQAVDVTDTSDPGRMPTFLAALEKLWPDLPITVCHTGQVYHYADAKIEFLHTIEDFYPKDISFLSQDPVNGSTAVFSVEIGGQKTMFYGDAAIGASKDMVEMWGDYLKSDIMQANHHGLNGSTKELYELTDPAVVLVPMGTRMLPNVLGFENSRWIWNNVSGNIREVILFGWGERVLELPYTPDDDTPYFSCGDMDPWAGLADEYKEDD